MPGGHPLTRVSARASSNRSRAPQELADLAKKEIDDLTHGDDAIWRWTFWEC